MRYKTVFLIYAVLLVISFVSILIWPSPALAKFMGNIMSILTLFFVIIPAIYFLFKWVGRNMKKAK